MYKLPVTAVWMMALAGLVSGCSRNFTPKVDISPSHPAHLQAIESVYRPPPNYFEIPLSGTRTGTGEKKKMHVPHGHSGGHVGHGDNMQPVDKAADTSGSDQHGEPHTEHGK